MHDTSSRHVDSATGRQALEDLHRECFACGVCNQGGLNLHFDIDDSGIARAMWQPSAAFCSYADRIHGGVIASMLDSSIVHALFARGIAGVTAELTIRYLHSTNLTDTVHIAGWVEAQRHGIYQCRAEIQQAGELTVRAFAKFMALPSNKVGH